MCLMSQETFRNVLLSMFSAAAFFLAATEPENQYVGGVSRRDWVAWHVRAKWTAHHLLQEAHRVGVTLVTQVATSSVGR